MNENGTYQWSPSDDFKKKLDFKNLPKLTLIALIVVALVIA